MKHSIVLIFYFLFSLVLSGQQQIDSSAAAKDFQIFKNILHQGHPGLYDYIQKDSLDQLILNYQDSIIGNTITDIKLFKNMLEITSKIGDGHLKLFAPSTIKTDQYYFPLILKIINSEFYTDTDDFNIPIGSRVLKINGITINQILEKLKKYSATDGYNLTKKYRDIELQFGLFYAYEYGIKKKFDIVYKTIDGEEKTITLEAESFSKVRIRNTKRKSYFASYHKQKDGILFFDQYIGKKEPFVHYKSDINTAILVVNSFAIDVRLFKSKLTKIFKEINRRKIKNLIVDVRNNEGGYRPNAIYLYSFLAKKHFQQRTSEFVASLSIPERKHAVHVTIEEEHYLKSKFYQHPEIDGWRVKYDDMQTIMSPDKNRFKGNVYVLVGGSTFSAGSEFALDIKNDPNIKLIGEETGGGYYFHSGDFPIYYEFPNSGIVMHLSMVKINHFIKDNSIDFGSGIPVDSYIPLTLQSITNGTDPQLDYAIKLISGSANK